MRTDDEPWIVRAVDGVGDHPHRSRRLCAGVALVAQCAALATHGHPVRLWWVAWTLGLVTVVRLWVADIPARSRERWLWADLSVVVLMLWALGDPTDAAVFQRAMIPVILAFLISRPNLGWALAGVLAAATLAVGASDLHAAPATARADLWVFWAGLPLVLSFGPFGMLPAARQRYGELRARLMTLHARRLECRRRRHEWAREATRRAVARRRMRSELHQGPQFWVEDVDDTLAELAHRVPPAGRRLIERLRADAVRCAEAGRRILMSLDEEDRAAPAAAHRTGTPGPRGPTQPRTWGWHSVDTRADLTHSVMRARLPAGLLVGCMAALGAFPPVGRPVYEPLALRIAVVVAALGLVGWVGITTLWRRRVLEAVKRRPALGAVEVGIGMALVGAGGPDGPFSGWTVAPIAVAAVLWPGLSRLAALCTLQLALMWGTGLAASLWGPAALARHVSWDRAGIAPLDALITYGLVLVLAAVLRAGDTLNAEAIRDIGRLSAEIKDLEAPVADRIGERVLMTRLELGVRRPMRRMVGDLGELSDRVEAERDLPPSVAGELRRLLRGARRMQRPAYGSTTLGSLLETEIRAAGIPCEVPEPEEGASLFDPLGTRISADAAEVLAGIVQEALQNMRRHGGGDGHIACRGRWGAAPEDDTVTLAFTNAPQGHHSRYARARAALPGRGHGRTLMTAAVARLGGWVGHRLDPDGSYVCEVHLPRRALADGARMAHGGAGS